MCELSNQDMLSITGGGVSIPTGIAVSLTRAVMYIINLFK